MIEEQLCDNYRAHGVAKACALGAQACVHMGHQYSQDGRACGGLYLLSEPFYMGGKTPREEATGGNT